MANQITRLYTGELMATIYDLFLYQDGAVVKTILLSHSSTSDVVVTLEIDGLGYTVTVPPGDMMVLKDPFVCYRLAAGATTTVNCHVSGIAIGEL